MRALGLRVVEAPESMRVTVPKWWGRFGTRVLEKTAKRVREDNSDDVDVRIVRRNLIVRLR